LGKLMPHRIGKLRMIPNLKKTLKNCQVNSARKKPDSGCCQMISTVCI